MTEFRVMALVTLGGVLAVVAARFGLGALGASDEQIAAAWGVCLVVTGFVGSFIFNRYTSPSKRR
jgi:lipid-binding SYLF domain-containing protein